MFESECGQTRTRQYLTHLAPIGQMLKPYNLSRIILNIAVVYLQVHDSQQKAKIVAYVLQWRTSDN